MNAPYDTRPIAIARRVGPRLLFQRFAERTCGSTMHIGLRCDLASLPPRAPGRLEITMEPRECPGFDGWAAELTRAAGPDLLHLRGARRMCEAGVRVLHVATAPDGSPAYCQWLVRAGDAQRIRAFAPTDYPDLEPSEVLLEGAYTFSSFRGMKLMADGMWQLLARARDGGADSALTYVEADNVPSLRGCANVGFQPDHVRRAVYRLGRKRTLVVPLDGKALKLWAAATA